ncbi:hypothetical protein E1A91_D09G095400v1 [Gossypium mustelinum]|uniref:Uncharacterized protein n=1 Tax=Gossypium mustelinum TaxID=34275 RepID=A0A5D2TIP8_GOSMU|nr:hypothetical protein E1A91_D09G095400v1 [Gossypium mustelinum]
MEVKKVIETFPPLEPRPQLKKGRAPPYQDRVHRQQQRAPDSIKDAYCAVALDCIAKYLAGYPDAYGAQYLDAVDRIWRGRIQDVERSKASDLVSQQLRNRRLLVEAAV